ncbi:hypothetical protein E4U58_007125 [Claviceps cyperi]|nr:hypothetical protein E4U58_007125 [Claviceps cyperi]
MRSDSNIRSRTKASPQQLEKAATAEAHGNQMGALQQLANSTSLMESLDTFASAYADAVLVFSGSEEKHWKHCEEVNHCLHKASVEKVDFKKDVNRYIRTCIVLLFSLESLARSAD